jgi:hypothetical protein
MDAAPAEAGTGANRKRSVNWLIWGGFAMTLAAALSYIPIFVQFPLTRDFPWVNLLLFAVAGWMLGAGLYRAYARSERHRGKISGPILGILTLGIFVFFYLGAFRFARQLPSPETALRVGQQAPEFTLTDSSGRPVSLAELRQGRRAVLLIFYRGYW